MFPTADDCNECRPAYLQRRLDSFPPSTVALSSVPFVFTFVVVAAIVSQRLPPLLAAHGLQSKQENGLSGFNTDATSARSCTPKTWAQVTTKRIGQVACAFTIALSAVLVELILCEISNMLNPAARGLALRTTLYSLLLLIVIIIPALEINSIINSWFNTGSNDPSTRKARLGGLKQVLKLAILGAWLVAFWYLPQTSLLAASLQTAPSLQIDDHDFVEASLERIGIIGISLMASLAGFAAVSSIWQAFGVKHRMVRETDITRKESGLAATRDMLLTKQSRLRALQSKMEEQTTNEKGFLSRVVSSMRGNKELTELRALEMEISGLESMSMSLSSSITNLKSRYATQQNAHTAFGRLTNAFNLAFALYCLYRIGATSLSSMRRWWQPSSTFSTSDPINNILALMTTHYDPSLDREAWARQFSFILSGFMLLLSFNAVLQSFRLFSRFAPGVVQLAQTSLPLIISQIAGTYVISSALLLRSNLPAEMSSVITEALGSGLDAWFVEHWFESWFLVAVGLTATGILVSRKVGSSDWDDWDDSGDLEMGKMN